MLCTYRLVIEIRNHAPFHTPHLLTHTVHRLEETMGESECIHTESAYDESTVLSRYT